MKTFMRIGKQSNHANKAIHWEQDLSFELQQWKHLYERGEITAEQYKKHTKDTIQKYESISNI